MEETVMIPLPKTMIEQAREIAQRTGQTLEALLAEWITQDIAKQNNNLYLSDPEYPIFTPPGNEHVAQALFETLQAAKAAKRAGTEER